LKKDVQDYVSKCQVCQQAKLEHSRLLGLLQPLPVPTQAWHTTSLDFIEGLLKSKKIDTILVVVDKLTKYGHFIPLSHPYTSMSVAQLFHNQELPTHHRKFRWNIFWAAEGIFTEVTRASEIPMEELILAESILSEFTWDFQHRSEVPIKDRKFRHFENQPNKR